jgi:hypothetical protein
MIAQQRFIAGEQVIYPATSFIELKYFDLRVHVYKTAMSFLRANHG